MRALLTSKKIMSVISIAVLVTVTTGAKVGGLVAIESAAKTGEKAIVKPPEDLADGAPVRTAAK